MSSFLLHGRKISQFHWLVWLTRIIYSQSNHLYEHPCNSDVKRQSAACRSLNQARTRITLIKAKTDQALCTYFQLSLSLVTVSLLPKPMILLLLFLFLSNQESVLKIVSIQLDSQTFCETVPWTISSFNLDLQIHCSVSDFLWPELLTKTSPEFSTFQWIGRWICENPVWVLFL